MGKKLLLNDASIIPRIVEINPLLAPIGKLHDPVSSSLGNPTRDNATEHPKIQYSAKFS